MANPFDEFDEKKSNPFDEFDAKDRSWSEAAMRQPGLTARSLGKGAVEFFAGIPALAGDAVYNAFQLGGKLKGNKDAQFGFPVSDALHSGLNKTADAIGLPAPDTPAERITQGGLETAMAVARPSNLIRKGLEVPLRLAGGISGVTGTALNEAGANPWVSAIGGLLAGPLAVLGGRGVKNWNTRPVNPTEQSNVAVNRALGDEFNIPLTKDQLTQNLTDRKTMDQMRWGGKGNSASEIVKNFDENQLAQLNNAQRDLITNISGVNAPRSTTEIGSAIQDNFSRARDTAKQNANAMYDKAFDPEELAQRNIPFKLTQDQFGSVGSRVRDSLINRSDPILVNERLTPNAMEALDIIDNFAQGRLPLPVNTRNAPPGFQRTAMTWRAVDQVRKFLQPLYKAAQGNDSDSRAMREIISNFDRSIAQGVPETIRLPNGATAQVPPLPTNTLLSDAISNYADYASKFKPQTKNSVTDSVIKQLSNPNADSNAVFNKVFGTAFNKGEAEYLVNHLKKVYANNPEGITALKEGGLRKLFLDANGDALTNGKIATNITNALGKQKDLYEALYTPEQLDRLKRFAELSDKINESKKRINGSGTNYPIVDTLDKRGWQAALGWIMGKVGSLAGPFGKVGGEILGAAGGDAIRNYQNARQATKMVQGQLPQYIEPPSYSLLQGGARSIQPLLGNITGDDMRRFGLLGQ